MSSSGFSINETSDVKFFFFIFVPCLCQKQRSGVYLMWNSKVRDESNFFFTFACLMHLLNSWIYFVTGSPEVHAVPRLQWTHTQAGSKGEPTPRLSDTVLGQMAPKCVYMCLLVCLFSCLLQVSQMLLKLSVFLHTSSCLLLFYDTSCCFVVFFISL